MIFNSISYIVFFPIVIFIYYLIPSRIRYLFLLLVSYYFYMCWDAKYTFLLILSTGITYLGGIGIEWLKIRNQEKFYIRLIISGELIINLGILFFYKYFDWALINIDRIFDTALENRINLVLPVGISFYTFQALGYFFDVYRGDIKAEKNILKYALYVSFFPQLVAGPIERSKDLLPQINSLEKIKWDIHNLRNGLLLILYGMFLKVVIADRTAVVVDNVFENFTLYGCVELWIAAILFAIQILCDFNGYTIIARGSAKCLGVSLSNNFRQPYFATNIQEFWRRWHISLSSWFTDYLYIPLGGNRKGKIKKYINIMVVFAISGLWHGAGWNYVMWGIFHGFFINIEHLNRDLKIKGEFIKNKYISSFLGRCITFIIVVMGWVFFRSNSLGSAIGYFKNMFQSLQQKSILELGIPGYEWLILIFSIFVLFIIDLCNEKEMDIFEYILNRNFIVRWIIYTFFIWIIIMFGYIGGEYDGSFIYFQF